MTRLSASGWLLLARMATWRLALPLLKRIVSLDRLVALLAAPRDRTRDPAREELIARIGGRLWRSSAGPCLERSLAVHRQLGLAGARPELHAGMAKENDAFVGHMWVTVDGSPLLEAGDPSTEFGVVVTYDERGHRRGDTYGVS
jgi:hypothetical protein